jgi:hypothetical protein
VGRVRDDGGDGGEAAGCVVAVGDGVGRISEVTDLGYRQAGRATE